MFNLYNSFGKLTTYHRFSDGTSLAKLHRYALIYKSCDKSMDIGFEQALEPGVDRLIHIRTISHWNTPYENLEVSSEDKNEILFKIMAYCKAKSLKYKLID